ncbi:hypothetical protein [Microbispora siamensis]|nr:hypothetical protein [Microbispora siamensis]
MITAGTDQPPPSAHRRRLRPACATNLLRALLVLTNLELDR